MRKLIITEKPSVAKDFAQALGCKRQDGFFEGAKYLITFCVGHLLELFEPGDYNPDYQKWSLDHLPIIPTSYRHKPVPLTVKQLNTIKSLITSEEFEEVILATDAGREGELIGRLVLNYCKFNQTAKLKRFWSSEALTEAVISRVLNSELVSDVTFDKLFQAGYYRQLADWLVGINFSRFFSLKLNADFSFGRVQTAVLRLICDRKNEIEHFIPKPFYQLLGMFSKGNQAFKAIYKDTEGNSKFAGDETLTNLALKLKDCKTAKVLSVEIKEKEVLPPELLNLTALQKEANKRFGYSAAKTLQIAQALYEEKKCLSYPRTPSKVLGEANVELVKTIISKLFDTYPDLSAYLDLSLVSKDNERVFNNNRLEDHHALIPLTSLPEGASTEEQNIYELVLRHFFAAFYPACRYYATSLILDVNEVQFSTTGRSLIAPGWTVILKPAQEEAKEKGEEEAEALPLLKEGEIIDFLSAR